MADHGNKCYVPGYAGDVKCRDGLMSVFRKARKANNARSNIITRATRDMVSFMLAVACYITVHKMSLTT